MTLLIAALLLSGEFSQANAISRRGWNSWDSSCAHDPAGNSDEARTLVVAAYMQQYLAPSGYNLLTVDEGWYWYGGQQSTNASLDGNGLPSPRLDQYPSAANGKGFGPLAATLQGTFGLDLGVWTMRGIPRAAAAARLPIAGSSYTCDQAVDVQRPNACSWNGYTYGCAVNASTGRCVDAAVAYYKSLAALYKRWGIRFVKVDCMWGGPTQGSYDADVIAFTEAFRDEGGMEISMSPGGGVSAQNISFLADNRLAVQTRVTDGSFTMALLLPWGAFPPSLTSSSPHLCPPPLTRTPDFWDSWGSLKTHISVAESFAPFFAAADTQATPTYPDLDMLPLGDIIHQGALSPSQFLPSEEQLLMTLWCFCGAPLIMGGNLPPSNNATLALITNPRLLAVHGEASGRRVLQGAGGEEVHAWGAIPKGAPKDAYLALLNAADVPQNVTLPLSSLPWLGQGGGGVCAIDLWEGTPVGAFASGVFFTELGPHSAGAFRLSAC